MTDVESAVPHSDLDTQAERKAEDLFLDVGKTSPLSEIGSLSPTYYKDEPFDENTNTETNPTTRDSEHDSHSNGISVALALAAASETPVKEERSKSVASYEYSDLSDLDSEAETVKASSANGTPKESQLSKLATNNKSNNNRRPATVDDVIRHTPEDHDREDAPDNTLIKDDVNDELQNGKESDIELESNEEDISKVVEELRKSEANEEDDDAEEEAEFSPLSNVSRSSSESAATSPTADSTTTTTATTATNGSVEKSSKRRINKDEETTEFVKRHKSNDDTVDAHLRGSIKKEAVKEIANGVRNKGEVEREGEEDGNGIDDQEPEDEDEDEDEEEEVELTEDQKKQKQLEAEADLEKQKERKEAIQFLTEIEIDFAKLRDRLYDDKMGRFKSELEMCLNGTHPELQSVYSKIDSHREDKMRLASLNQKYKLDCIDRQIRAERTAVHQQYYKKASEYKAKYIREVMTKWDQITKERQEHDTKPSVLKYKIPQYVDDLVSQRSQVNQEISNLVGLNLYYGFPTAPKLKQADSDELDQDLRAMKTPVSDT